MPSATTEPVRPATGPGEAVLEARGLTRSYLGLPGRGIEVLRGLNLSLAAGAAVAIVGASGSGKSTLLHLLGALDRPTAGTVRLGGVDLATLDDDRAAALRNRSVGFVFQFHHLLVDFTALENAMMPGLIRGDTPAEVRERAAKLLEQVGLGHRLGHRPGQLSGGEQQRVAVARALVNQPLVVLADEPTGNLDARASRQVQDLLFGLRKRHRVALVVATHNRELASRAERVLRLREGVLEDA